MRYTLKKNGCNLKIKSVEKGSAAYAAGLRCEDIIVSVNNNRMEDELDFVYQSEDATVEIIFIRNGKQRFASIPSHDGKSFGVQFYPRLIQQCTNRCIFCFIDQMPPGLRRSLYIKDEDPYHSFINGNYLTLTNISGNEFDKIIRMRLSPLYVSVHAVDRNVRNRMLGNRLAPDILEQLRYLQKNGIAFHTQIVVCEGINDGDVLEETVNSLLSLKKNLLSIALVPVGLTRFRKPALTPVSKNNALYICTRYTAQGDRIKEKYGSRKVFCSDELFIKAQLPLPGPAYYEEYPQLENGVGLVRLLLDEWKTIRNASRKGKTTVNKKIKRRSIAPGAVGVVTSVDAYPYLLRIVEDFLSHTSEANVAVVPVKNLFFGKSVTVAGLLTAGDILRTVKKCNHGWKEIIVPGVIFNYNGNTIDGFSKARMERKAGIKISVAGSVGEMADILNRKYFCN